MQNEPLTPAARAARREKERIKGIENMALFRAEEAAFKANFERLKAERKSRESSS